MRWPCLETLATDKLRPSIRRLPASLSCSACSATSRTAGGSAFGDVQPTLDLFYLFPQALNLGLEVGGDIDGLRQSIDLFVDVFQVAEHPVVGLIGHGVVSVFGAKSSWLPGPEYTAGRFSSRRPGSVGQGRSACQTMRRLMKAPLNKEEGQHFRYHLAACSVAGRPIRPRSATMLLPSIKKIILCQPSCRSEGAMDKPVRGIQPLLPRTGRSSCRNHRRPGRR